MFVRIDIRETDLIQKIQLLVQTNPKFDKLIIKTEVLPIGDIIISINETDEDSYLLLIERKTIADLLSSIKDGRYEEQSYRLNGLNHHNHNIIYLIEGDVNKGSFIHKGTSRDIAYSAMFSLNYYKGFSLVRSFSLEESATMICNMAYKIEKELGLNVKKSYYTNKKEKGDEYVKDEKDVKDEYVKDVKDEYEVKCVPNDYVSVIKKVKKENITPDNICAIMLCQIPGISAVTAIAIMDKFKTMLELLKEIELNPDCLNDITTTNAKGQVRKINKSSLSNIVQFLLKK
jgi:ERCC4-type nuclease